MRRRRQARPSGYGGGLGFGKGFGDPKRRMPDVLVKRLKILPEFYDPVQQENQLIGDAAQHVVFPVEAFPDKD
jgi:hypothetical protein